MDAAKTAPGALASPAVLFAAVADALGLAATIAGGVVAALALARAVWNVYRRTLGRRRDYYRRLARLGTNAQVSFFTSVLGEPPALRRKLDADITEWDEHGRPRLVRASFWDCVYIDRDFYVHALADENDTVLAFAVTSRSKRFRPRFVSPGSEYVLPGRLRRALRLPERFRPMFKVKLGSTRLVAVGTPDRVVAWLGAHNFHYFEAHYHGNPGNYQTFVFAVNDAGAFVWDAPIRTLFPGDAPWDLRWEPSPDEGDDPFEEIDLDDAAALEAALELPEPSAEEVFHDAPHLLAFRRASTFNTYAVLGLTLSLDNYPATWGNDVIFGPNSNFVRTLP